MCQDCGTHYTNYTNILCLIYIIRIQVLMIPSICQDSELFKLLIRDFIIANVCCERLQLDGIENIKL